ncbi:MAG: 50S ribosome-binding GTPase [Synergistaceae bacterium]|nr:50S ribosome-binding GTPase [Synergistaceae bacterium]
MPRTVWYPGHMARGGRELAELAKRLDLIVEVRDARAPFSTSSPLSASLAARLPILRVLSKADLADPEATRAWKVALGEGTWALDLRARGGVGQLRKALLARRPAHRELRLAVMGIPNGGTSMLLNALIARSRAQVGGVPGVTRSVSWHRSDGLLIVDSPGILDPHAAPGAHLALSWLGCAKADVLGGSEAAATELIRFLRARGLLSRMLRKWDVEEADGEDPSTTLERVGRRLGCLVTGGAVDRELAGRRLVDAFSTGRLGPVTLELPGGPTALDDAGDV